jgi:diguanylate cyclase (GGDEF)-like protein
MGQLIEPVNETRPSPALSLARLISGVREIRESLMDVRSDLRASRTDQAQESRPVERKLARVTGALDSLIGELGNELTGRTDMLMELTELRSELKVHRYHLAMLKAREETFRQIALHDPLTGLANRALFEESVEQGMAVARRHAWGLAVLFMDVDKFKAINDQHGHAVGDDVLRHVAACLRAFLREGDTVSRWGGDEFTCLLLEIPSEVDARRVAESMITRLAEPCVFGGVTLTIGASIGIARYPNDGDAVDLLVRRADRAMYHAKQAGRRVMLFSECPPA